MSSQLIPLKNVLQHNKKDDLWIIIHGEIFDVSKWLTEHPGGLDCIVNAAKKNRHDCSTCFEEKFHTPNATEQMQKLKVGKLLVASKGNNNCILL